MACSSAVRTDATDDIKWKVALCTFNAAAGSSPMQLATALKRSHAASLMLKIVALSWSTLVATDAIYMPHFIGLLKRFPTLAVLFLTDQIKLAQSGQRFYLDSGRVVLRGVVHNGYVLLYH
jgi:hypothetical protein